MPSVQLTCARRPAISRVYRRRPNAAARYDQRESVELAFVVVGSCGVGRSDLDVDTVVDLAHRAGSAPELNRSSQRLGL